MSLWPDVIDCEEVKSPRQILHEAAEELERRNSRLTASVIEETLSDRVLLRFQMHNRSADVTLELFSVAHRKTDTYPAAIDSDELSLPGFLKRSRTVPNPSNLSKHLFDDRTIQNDWVCSTPKDFEVKLKELLSGDYVKARIVSLLAMSGGDSKSAEASG